MTKRPLIDASIADIRAAVYAEGPLRHEYQKEPATFVLELCARVEELSVSTSKMRELEKAAERIVHEW